MIVSVQTWWMVHEFENENWSNLMNGSWVWEWKLNKPWLGRHLVHSSMPQILTGWFFQLHSHQSGANGPVDHRVTHVFKNLVKCVHEKPCSPKRTKLNSPVVVWKFCRFSEHDQALHWITPKAHLTPLHKIPGQKWGRKLVNKMKCFRTKEKHTVSHGTCKISNQSTWVRKCSHL